MLLQILLIFICSFVLLTVILCLCTAADEADKYIEKTIKNKNNIEL